MDSINKKYTITKHDDVIESMRDAIKRANISKDFTSKIELYENGAKMKGWILFNDLKFAPAVGDTIKFQVLFYNSYDKSWAVQQKAMGYRLFCKNGCADEETIANTFSKHTGSNELKASADKIQNAAHIFMNNENKYKKWIARKIDDSFAIDFLTTQICSKKTNLDQDINKKDLNRLVGKWNDNKAEVGSNLWGFYNTLTHWSSHNEHSKSPHKVNYEKETLLTKVMRHKIWKDV